MFIKPYKSCNTYFKNTEKAIYKTLQLTTQTTLEYSVIIRM